MVVVESAVGLILAFGFCGFGAGESWVVGVLQKDALLCGLVAFWFVLVH